MPEALRYYLAVQLAAAAFLPLAARLFRRSPDRGWALAKPLGVFALALADRWLFASGLLDAPPATRTRALLVLLLAGAAATLAEPRRRRWLAALVMSRGRALLAVEAIFLFALAGGLLLRSLDPGAGHTEQPMDLMQLANELDAPAWPPLDPWLAGVPVGYYTLGHGAAAALARVAGVPAGIAYNLALAAWFALAAVALAGVGFALTRWTGRGRRLRALALPLAAPLVLVAANPRAVLDALHRLGGIASGVVRTDWWWWRSSRLVFDAAAPPGLREVISEFPQFAFVVGDLHPHLLALPLVLLAAGLALACARAPRLRSAELAAAALVAGAAVATNSWDLPLVLLLLAGGAALGGLDRNERLGRALRIAGAALAGGALVALPHLAVADAPISALVVNGRTPSSPAELGALFGALLPGLALLFAAELAARPAARRRALAGALAGALVAILLPALAAALAAAPGAGGLERADAASATSVAGALAERGLPGALAAALAGALAVGAAALASRGREPAAGERISTGAALLLVAVGAALVTGAELFFLRDTFGTRLNTLFKLHAGAWPLLALGAVAGALAARRRGPRWAAAGVVALAAIAGGALFGGTVALERALVAGRPVARRARAARRFRSRRARGDPLGARLRAARRAPARSAGRELPAGAEPDLRGHRARDAARLAQPRAAVARPALRGPRRRPRGGRRRDLRRRVGRGEGRRDGALRPRLRARRPGRACALRRLAGERAGARRRCRAGLRARRGRDLEATDAVSADISATARTDRLERAAWLALLALAALWRFADLGTRAMSHDESLHAYYSWRYAELGEYAHDPLLHGPFLFHVQALVFLLFGDGDSTARLLPAAAGVLLVGAPWLFRRELGRRGALAAGALLLASPAVAFYSRYLRNDVWCALFALLWARALLDYRERGAPAALSRMALAMALSFAAKEVAYLTGAGFGAICLVAAVAQISAAPARWRECRWLDLAAVQLALVAPYLAAFGRLATGADPADFDAPGATAGAVTWGAAFAALGLAAALAWFRAAGRELTRNLLAAFGIFWGLLLPLYTSLGSRLGRGLASGIAGSLGYWLAQHGVERGGQPVFFYALLALLYEPLVWALSLAAALALLLRLRRPAPAAGGAGPASALGERTALVLALWSAAAWLGYSLAGERMPWLLVHIVVPGALLAGWWLDGRLPRQTTPAEARRIAGLALGIAAATLLAAGLVAHTAPGPARLTRGALLAALVAGGLAWLAVEARRVGRPATRRLALLGLGGAAYLLVARTALVACFAHAELAVEPLVYAHGTPAVKPALAELESVSRRLAGGLDLEVAYDFETSWPMAWYLRHFPRAHGFTAPPDEHALDAPALLLGDGAERAAGERIAERLAGRARIPFDLLWWPVDTYRGWGPADLAQKATEPGEPAPRRRLLVLPRAARRRPRPLALAQERGALPAGAPPARPGAAGRSLRAGRAAARQHAGRRPGAGAPRRLERALHFDRGGERARVDPVGMVEGRLVADAEQALDRFHALHVGVVLVGDLVAPGAEAAAGQDAVRLEGRAERGERLVAAEVGGRVAVLLAPVPEAHDLRLQGHEPVGAQRGQRVGRHSRGVDRAVGALADLGHQRPAARLRHVVRRVVREDGDPEVGARRLRKVDPALGGEALRARAGETDADHVHRALRQRRGGGARRGVETLGERGEAVERQRRDRVVEAERLAAFEPGRAGAQVEPD